MTRVRCGDGGRGERRRCNFKEGMSVKKRLMLAVLVAGVAVGSPGTAARAQGAAPQARDPYLGAIVVDAANGNVLFEDRADTRGAPASMLKLMDLLLVLERIEQGKLKLSDPVLVTAEASRIGGSQVYLKEHEQFTVEELLYALMVQSANDAATALAIHLAGSKEAFVELMNRRAKELGMASTVFQSVHGLPPGAGQTADMTTPRDFAILCRELTRRAEALRFTSERKRAFRENPPFVMETHNSLLLNFPGCDGLKTGYYRVAGYSIAATARRDDGARAIVVIMGSKDKTTRDAKARDLLARGLAAAVADPNSASAPAPRPVAPKAPAIEIPASAADLLRPPKTPAP